MKEHNSGRNGHKQVYRPIFTDVNRTTNFTCWVEDTIFYRWLPAVLIRNYVGGWHTLSKSLNYTTLAFISLCQNRKSKTEANAVQASLVFEVRPQVPSFCFLRKAWLHCIQLDCNSEKRDRQLMSKKEKDDSYVAKWDHIYGYSTSYISSYNIIRSAAHASTHYDYLTTSTKFHN